MFTATAVLCNSVKDCLKLETSQNNYRGILVEIHRGETREITRDLFACGIVGTLQTVTEDQR